LINRNLIVLAVCQLIAATGAVVMVTLGGIIGAELTSNPAWATLPVSIWVLSTAATTVPAALLMRRIGRPLGFSLAALSASGAVLVALWALQQESFAGFLVAAAIYGVNMAFAQQFRFAAVESTTPQYAGRAVSLVLIGSVGGALLGPEIVRLTASAGNGVPYEGTMLSLAVLYGVGAISALFLRRSTEGTDAADSVPARSLRAITRQPVFIVAVLGGAVGFGVMVFVMTATPLSMHTIDGFTLEETAAVVRAHVLGMYLPSLVSGYLIDRLGVMRMMSVGAVTLLLALGAGVSGQALHHYWIALVLLGVGWNFLFVGATTLLTFTYASSERFRAQAVNEFCVFGITAAGSLLAGTIMYVFGWFTTVTAPIPLLLLILGALYLVRRDPVIMTRQPV
jgi:MFS family permease